jgi:hypothetical protein
MVYRFSSPSLERLGYFQTQMPPRRDWGIFGLGFYKDGAPAALETIFSM